MKIVFRGELPENEVWSGTCSYCKSVIEASRKELIPQPTQRDVTWAIESCPVCKKEMFFYEKGKYEGN